MKSLANVLLKVAEGILLDYQLSYPADKKDICRDKKRLTLLVEERGLSTFVLDLPALESLLLEGLESGRLIACGALSKRASSTILVPRLFRGLWLRIFDVSGDLSKEPDPHAIFLLRQLLCLGKKLEVDSSPSRREAVIKDYYNVESGIRAPTLSWTNDYLGSDDVISANSLCDCCADTVGDEQPSFWDDNASDGKDAYPQRIRTLLRRLQRNADAFSEAIGKYDPYEFSGFVSKLSVGIGLRHGPGAVAETIKKGFKYDFPNWPAKLHREFGFDSFGGIRARKVGSSCGQPTFEFEPPTSEFPCQVLCSEVVSADDHLYGVNPEMGCSDRDDACTAPAYRGFADFVRPSLHEPPARLLAVPKTAKGPRLIAAEPTAHQWCQQLTRRFLSERLKGLFADNFICFEKQELSAGMVVDASLNKRLATVDLSSASDRLSCWVVERVFRKNIPLLRALHSHRTRWVVKDKTISSQQEPLILKKFASQGTAVTFPVQTIIFFLCAITASGFDAKGPEDFICNNRICNSIGRFRNKVRVYGDDIIIPTNGYEPLVSLLHTLGLKVNTEKSFHRGHFRESCGMDAFAGVDVTPVKMRKVVATGPQSRQSLIDYTNLFFKKGLWHAAKAIELTLPGWVINNLPVTGPGCGGIGRFSFCGSSVDHLRKRWNTKLHRVEIRTYAMLTRMHRTPCNTTSALLQYFAEDPSPLRRWTNGYDGRPKTSDGLRWEFPHFVDTSSVHLDSLIKG